MLHGVRQVASRKYRGHRHQWAAVETGLTKRRPRTRRLFISSMEGFMRGVYRMVCIGFVVSLVAASTASAQCQRCTSSSSCGSSTLRGGCSFFCTSGGSCICSDDTCPKPKPTRHFEPLTNLDGVSVLALRAEPQIRLLSACDGRWLGVAFTTEKAVFVRAAMHVFTVSEAPSVAWVARRSRVQYAARL